MNSAWVRKVFTIQTLIFSVSIFSLLPLIIISFYNHPSSDDFCFHCKSRDFGFWNAQWDWYNQWSGRYFSSAILSIRLLVSGSFIVYKLIPITLLFSMGLAIYYLSKAVFSKFSNRDSFILAILCLTMYLIQMPSITQGFFWLSAAVTYQLANVLTVMFGFCLIKLLEGNQMRYLIASIVLSFAIIGSNEVSMIYINYLVGVVLIFRFVQHRTLNYSVLVLLLCSILFSLIVINAPGNMIRKEFYSGKYNLADAFIDTVKALKNYLSNWLPLIIALILIYYHYLGKRIGAFTSNLFRINPLLLFLIVFAFPFIGFFAVAWQLGSLPPWRTINVIYFHFMFGLIFLSFGMLYYFNDRNRAFKIFSRWIRYLVIITLFISLIRENNIRAAYLDLFSGSAYKYDSEMKKRYELIGNSASDVVYVPALSSFPSTIYSDDISDDPKDWRNMCYSSYYHLKTIIIK